MNGSGRRCLAGARSRKVLLKTRCTCFATVECKISDARLKGRRKRLRGSNAGVGRGTSGTGTGGSSNWRDKRIGGP